MITLRLFEAANPFNQIAAYELGPGNTIIGRDPSADWVIDDRFGDLSRRHCVVRLDNGRILVSDMSSNGMCVGPDKIPMAREVETELKPGQMFYLGQYAILLDGDATLNERPRASRPRAGNAPTEAALLEHFCIGAGLERSSFAGEDPRLLMERLGAVYRQVVDDLCDLMRNRSIVKDNLQIDRTTIAARDNNPLKWAPARRIAVEILQDGENSFLKGRDAFRASFADLRRHGEGLTEGSRAAIAFVLSELEPGRIEGSAKSQSLGFLGRGEAAWKRYLQAHAALAADAADEKGRISGALRAGYEASLRSQSDQEDAA